MCQGFGLKKHDEISEIDRTSNEGHDILAQRLDAPAA